MADNVISVKVTGDSSSFEKSMSTSQRALDNFSKKFEGISTKIDSMAKAFTPISTAAAAVTGISTNMYLKFEDNIANINTLLNDTTNLKNYENTVKDMSQETGISLDIMAQGMYQAISSLGDGGAETEKIFSIMGKSAKAGSAEVSDSVSLISAGMKGYNQINAETAQKISDLAFQTAKLGVTTFPEMAKSMQPLFPLSNSLNISYEELFGTMATLTGVTGNTAEVSTQLKAVMSGLMQPTAAMSGLLEKYGYTNGAAMIESEGLAGVLGILQTETGGQSDKLAELFGSIEAVTAITALTGSQFDTFIEKLAEMENATGATQAAYDKMATTGDLLRKSFNIIKLGAVELGGVFADMLAPNLKIAHQVLTDMLDGFRGLDTSTQQTIAKFILLTAAIAPALMMLTGVTRGISSVASTLAFIISPIGLVVLAIGALVAGFLYLMNTNQKFHDTVIAIWDSVKTKIETVVSGISFGSMFSGFLEVINGMIPTFASVFTTIGSVVNILVQAFEGFFSGLSVGFTSGVSGASGFSTGIMALIGLICPPLKAVLLLFQNFAPQIQSLVTAVGSSLVPAFATLGTTIGGIASAVMPAIQSAMANLIPVIAMIIAAVTQIITTVLPVMVSLMNQLAPFLVQIAQMIGQIVAALAPMVAQLVGALLPVITNIVTVIMNVITAAMPALIAIMNVIMALIQAIVPVVTNILSVVISVISGIISAITPIISFIGLVITAIMAVISPIVTFIANIIATIIRVIGTVIGAVSGVFSTVFSIVSGVFSSISNIVGTVISVISTIISTLTGVFGGVFNSIYAIVSGIMNNVGSCISNIFNGIKSAWNGLTSFVSGVFSGVAGAVQTLVGQVKGFVNGVISGINAAVSLINMIPGVSIGSIPYLLHGTDNWSGGFARMNEGGRGELTYLPDGTQVIPHDISMKYAKESARANTVSEAMDIQALGNYIVEAVTEQGVQISAGVQNGISKMRMTADGREIVRYLEGLGFVRG